MCFHWPLKMVFSFPSTLDFIFITLQGETVPSSPPPPLPRELGAGPRLLLCQWSCRASWAPGSEWTGFSGLWWWWTDLSAELSPSGSRTETQSPGVFRGASCSRSSQSLSESAGCAGAGHRFVAPQTSGGESWTQAGNCHSAGAQGLHSSRWCLGSVAQPHWAPTSASGVHEGEGLWMRVGWLQSLALLWRPGPYLLKSLPTSITKADNWWRLSLLILTTTLGEEKISIINSILQIFLNLRLRERS